MIALVLAACGPRASEPPTPEPVAPTLVTAGPAVPSIERGAIDPDPGGTPLVITTDAVTMGEGEPIVRLADGRFDDADVRGGPHGILVPLVSTALQASPSAAITIAVDPSIPFVTVARVVYSAGQASRSSISFAVQRGTERGVVSIELPTLGRASAEAAADPVAAEAAEEALAEVEALLARDQGEDPRTAVDAREPTAPIHAEAATPRAVDASLALSIDAQGMTVRRSGERLAPGCTESASGSEPTVPRTTTGHDLDALAVCLARVRAAHPTEEPLTITPEADVPFADVARAIAVSHGTDASRLFPDVRLAMTAW